MTRDAILSAMAQTLIEGEDIKEMETRTGATDYEHLRSMYVRASAPDFSLGKANRWLGYMQGVMVAMGVLDLDDVKDISKLASERFPEAE